MRVRSRMLVSHRAGRSINHPKLPRCRWRWRLAVGGSKPASQTTSVPTSDSTPWVRVRTASLLPSGCPHRAMGGCGMRPGRPGQCRTGSTLFSRHACSHRPLCPRFQSSRQPSPRGKAPFRSALQRSRSWLPPWCPSRACGHLSLHQPLAPNTLLSCPETGPRTSRGRRARARHGPFSGSCSPSPVPTQATPRREGSTSAPRCGV
mmetsp:Transcript_163637/g.524710  ORF Transcript_163637/g.524710 Transcript_163637/m.524710 type:complete len:205 (-) Transcript_163637:1356-1970(-)